MKTLMIESDKLIHLAMPLSQDVKRAVLAGIVFSDGRVIVTRVEGYIAAHLTKFNFPFKIVKEE